MKKTMLISLFMMIALLLPIASADQLADIKSAGKIIVGSDTTYAPFESIDTANDVAVGFDVDLAKVVAEGIGVKAQIQTVVWESIIPSLKNEEFDVIISAMTITEDRALEIAFSNPYYNSSQGILVADGNPLSIADETDLEVATVKIGVQTGTTSDIYVTDNVNIVEAQITRIADFDALYLLLDNDEIDVILGDSPVIGYAASTGAVSGEVVGIFGDVEPFGIGMRKGETTLLAEVNTVLGAIFADGTYDDLVECWFGYRPLGTTTGPTTGCDFGELYKASKDDSPLDTITVLLGLISSVVMLSIIRKKRN